MNRLRAFMAVAALAVGTFTLVAADGGVSKQDGGATEAATNFAMSFNIVPNGDQYVMTAVISDLGTGEVLSAPRISVASDQEGVVVSEGPNRRIRITVKASKESAAIQATITVDGKVVAQQKTNVKI